MLEIEGTGKLKKILPLMGVLVKAEKGKKKEREVGGLILSIESEAGNREFFEDNVTQDGIVHMTHEKAFDKSPVEIKKGDHIYCHHFLCHDDNKVIFKIGLKEKVFYKMYYERDKNAHPLELY
jgi:hypothetical protein